MNISLGYTHPSITSKFFAGYSNSYGLNISPRARPHSHTNKSQDSRLKSGVKRERKLNERANTGQASLLLACREPSTREHTAHRTAVRAHSHTDHSHRHTTNCTHRQGSGGSHSQHAAVSHVL